MTATLRWEKIEDNDHAGMGSHRAFRARVPGGWLVETWTKGTDNSPVWGGGLTFVPDPEHTWGDGGT